MTRILGIDPGSRKTGYGLIDIQRGGAVYVASGVVRIPDTPLPERLKLIFDAISQIAQQYEPEQMAIENVFMSKSAGSALKLGQARGAAIVAGTHAGLPVSEYEARKVKQAVVGSGAADKLQVQHMVKTLLRLPAAPQEDAADALAVALCHMHTMQTLVQTAGSAHSRFRRGRLTIS
ncbi:crossover junction endodeoxyribonuclease RuvC [Microbulbifer flavimaris]|uniref:Crossover junction endodeoxyribonuclease RuvC n=1 Tax=Microbulbifer flavimaris TaxID=1781068 RepID=A0ABX4I193_9GAMM|nr:MULTISPECIES: crossover junction endodeoxyribonuclease RuvC [Microbulbifer]KUJ83413.1 Holliday junction resolvase [Microbulbifer sp. ZGT114]PCO05568.1 crossover junction endodeoxyribonuclease RuvC [Microbulbifer flavimaris]